MKQHTFYFVLLLTVQQLFADISSSSGNISFDINNDGNGEMLLNSTGLGIGTNSPSANLHIQGNAIFTGDVSIGTAASANSTLEIHGSIGFSIQTVSSNSKLSGNSIVLADSSAGNITITLPAASDISGRVYNIKKISSSSNVYITGGLMDNYTDIPLETASGTLPYLNLISGGGNQWHITSMMGNGTLASSDNLIGWWRFEETSGTSASDSSSKENSGDLINGLALSGVSGTIGNALTFDGSDDYVSIGDKNEFDFGTDIDFSVSVWIKVPAQSTDRILVKIKGNSQADADNGFTFDLNSGKPRFFEEWGAGVLVTATNALTINTWHHVAWVINRDSGIDIYIDGINDKSTADTTSGTSFTGDDPLQLGKFGTETSFVLDGSLDDVRIYNKALTAVEVQALYLLGK